nr:class I SAM-dependent methyltransferase [Echinicola vietnamensis]
MKWQYDEFKQIGRDYSKREEVEQYEQTHALFRDLLKESIDILEALELSAKDTLVDFGSGTGKLAIEAAKRCRQVYAVDISCEMLEYSRKRAREEGWPISNLSTPVF